MDHVYNVIIITLFCVIIKINELILCIFFISKPVTCNPALKPFKNYETRVRMPTKSILKPFNDVIHRYVNLNMHEFAKKNLPQGLGHRVPYFRTSFDHIAVLRIP